MNLTLIRMCELVFIINSQAGNSYCLSFLFQTLLILRQFYDRVDNHIPISTVSAFTILFCIIILLPGIAFFISQFLTDLLF